MQIQLTMEQIKLLIKQQTDYSFTELENRVYAANVRIDKLVKINKLLVEKVKKMEKDLNAN